MKKVFFLLALLSLLFCETELAAKGAAVVTPGAPRAEVTVTELPLFGSARTNGTPLFTFNCTNHTAVSQEIEIMLSARYRADIKILQVVQLPPLAKRKISILTPAVNAHSTFFQIETRSLNGSSLKFNNADHPWNVQRDVLSPAFKPDIKEYLFSDFQKSPLPVKEWPGDPRVYAGLNSIVLDSTDTLSADVLQALRLAAAQGTRVLVLVMGKNEWPSYAGKEIRGRAFTEKIGFGTWTVMRSQAVDSNPAWKNFVKRKHEAAKNGRYSRAYKTIRWRENLDRYLRTGNDLENLAKNSTIAAPPIPMTGLTFTMIFFVIIIGPVNYMVLKKRRAEIWSLVTIPALSLLFSGAVVATVFFNEGIYSQGTGSVRTLLDQTSGLAASRGGFGIYSPLSVGDFKFTADDRLFFYAPGKVNGTAEGNDYIYSGALVRARMGFGYAVSRSELRSEKIAVTEKEGSVEIVNGLGVKVDSLYLRNSKGQYFKLSAPLLPGARAQLLPVAKFPAKEESIGINCYRAVLSEPLFIKPGLLPSKYKHTQTLLGRWR